VSGAGYRATGRVWTLVGALILALLGLPACGTGADAPSSAGTSAQVTEGPEGWFWIVEDAAGQAVYFQQGIDPPIRALVTQVIAVAGTEAPALVGMAPPSDVSYYVLADRPTMQRALRELAQLAPSEVPIWAVGYSHFRGPRPGFYFAAEGLQSEPSGLLWDTGHEVGHYAVEILTQGNPVPQWFVEGVAELLTAQVVGQRDPAYRARADFIAGMRLANASRSGAVPPLARLVSNRQWLAATQTQDPELLYIAARWALERQTGPSRASALAPVLAGVGAGQPFNEAFAEAFSLPVNLVDLDLAEHVAGELAQRYPAGLAVEPAAIPIGGRGQFVMAGAQAGERMQLDFRGPGSCTGRGVIQTDRLGFGTYWLSVREAECRGPWSAEASGDQGTRAASSFSFN
jgi:hypothetical protein